MPSAVELIIPLKLNIPVPEWVGQLLTAIGDLQTLLTKQGAMEMSALDDLNNSLNDAKTAGMAAIAQVEQAVADIQALLSQLAGGATPAQLEALVPQIEQNVTALNTATAALQAAHNLIPTPTPPAPPAPPSA